MDSIIVKLDFECDHGQYIEIKGKSRTEMKRIYAEYQEVAQDCTNEEFLNYLYNNGIEYQTWVVDLILTDYEHGEER